MGYVNDKHMSQFIPCTSFVCLTGTWTEAAGQIAGTVCKHVVAADEVVTVTIPIPIPSNSVASSEKGSLLKSVEIDFEILVASCDALSAVINKVTRGADGSVATVAAQSFTYDTGHDTAAERIDVDQHKMTLTLDSPFWLDNDEYVLVVVTADKAATTTIDFLDAVANYTLRE